jgi:hypothetical protein
MSFIGSRLTGAPLRDFDKGFEQARVVCQEKFMSKQMSKLRQEKLKRER